jgi:serine/tyrosine/threonine adenylyltransferase
MQMTKKITDTATAGGWNFDNSYARLPELLYTRLNPTAVNSPRLIKLNDTLAASLGLDAEALNSDVGAGIFAGNIVPEGAEPLAQAYAGHQFGHFAMLGDGRAVLLGEQIAPDGSRFDVQLKGSGPTPYSRSGDGRAAVGPMLREYMISEAMHGLGIPTTRSLAVASTGEPVYRYTEEPGAVLTRIAASHIRVGTFQYASYRGTSQDLEALAVYTLQRHYPQAGAGDSVGLTLLREVIKRQASLIAKWQLVGFIHGVMNTDNMALSGETIDYGPCAFMDAYDPSTVFSSIDREGRYAYGNQPKIAGWNLARFAEALLPLLHEDEEQAIERAEDAIDEYPKLYQRYWLAGMRAKLGISDEDPEDEALIAELLTMMNKHHADYTNTFRAMTLGQLEGMFLFSTAEFEAWYSRWQARLGRQPESQVTPRNLMQRSNPAVIPRNHRVEEALSAAVEGDYSVMERLLAVLACPYAYSAEQDEYAALPERTNPAYRTYCGT